MKRTVLIFCFLGLTFLSAKAQDDSVLFSIGLIADVQYADADTWGQRDYRGSLKRLENALSILDAHDLAFTVHAGDLIDRYYESFDPVFNIFRGSKSKVHYVVGNHEFSVADSLKGQVRKRLNNPRGYYAFEKNNFQFILLDAMDVSVHSAVAGSRRWKDAAAMQKELRDDKANNAHDYNGALGKSQLRWLKRKLRRAERKGNRTILFSHLPLLPENGLQLWNNRDVLALLNSFPSVVGFFSGHHHEGNYVRSGDIHHLTLKGLVESKESTACAIADIYHDKIVIRGFGDQPSFELPF